MATDHEFSIAIHYIVWPDEVKSTYRQVPTVYQTET